MKHGAELSVEKLRHLLSEREKELDAVYELASLFAQPGIASGELLARTASILRRSMEHPELAVVNIWTGDEETQAASAAHPVDLYRVERTYSIDKTVTVCAGYEKGVEMPSQDPRVSDREHRLVTSAATLLSEVLQRIEMENVLRESTKALQRQAEELEQKNSALREVLSHIEYEKKRVVEIARTHVAMFIQPYLHRLRESADLSANERACVEQLAHAIENLFKPEEDTIVRLVDRLSPRELEICDLVRNGMTTKEVSSFLHLTETTVERHRNNIRRKLKLTGSKANLTSYLRQQKT